MLEVTERARTILARARDAASRFNPDVCIRVVARAGAVVSELTEGPAEGDVLLEERIYVDPTVEGVLDGQDPHEQLVLRGPQP